MRNKISGRQAIQTIQGNPAEDSTGRGWLPLIGTLIGQKEICSGLALAILASIIAAGGCSRVMSSNQGDLFGRKNPEQVQQWESPSPVRRNDSMADIEGEALIASRQTRQNQFAQNQFANPGSVALPLRAERKLGPMEELEFPGEAEMEAGTQAEMEAGTQAEMEGENQPKIALVSHADLLTDETSRPIVLAFSDGADSAAESSAEIATAGPSDRSKPQEASTSQVPTPDGPLVLEARTAVSGEEFSWTRSGQPVPLAQIEKQNRRDYRLMDPVDLPAQQLTDRNDSLSVESSDQRVSWKLADENTRPWQLGAEGSMSVRGEIRESGIASSSFSFGDEESRPVVNLDRDQNLLWETQGLPIYTLCRRIVVALLHPSLQGCRWVFSLTGKSREAGPDVTQAGSQTPEKSENTTGGISLLSSAGIRVDQSAFADDNSSLPETSLNTHSRTSPVKEGSRGSGSAPVPASSDQGSPRQPGFQSEDQRDFQLPASPGPLASPPSSFHPENGQFSKPIPAADSPSLEDRLSPGFVADQQGMDPSSFEAGLVESRPAAGGNRLAWWMIGAGANPASLTESSSSSAAGIWLLPVPTAVSVGRPSPGGDGKELDTPFDSTNSSIQPVGTADFLPAAANPVSQAGPVPKPLVSEEEKNRLRIANPQFCSEIRGFGQITPLPKNQFAPLQRVLLYCEVENYQSRKERSDEHGTVYLTRFIGSYQLTDSRGEVVQSGQLPEILDRAPRLRQDFYLYFPITFGALPNGEYQLAIRLTELLDGSSGDEPGATREAFVQGLPVGIFR